jgi:hypothetical protein
VTIRVEALRCDVVVASSESCEPRHSGHGEEASPELVSAYTMSEERAFGYEKRPTARSVGTI